MRYSNHELAKRYIEKSKLIGKDIMKLRLIDDDRVVLDEVMDKVDSGRLIIPGFITDIKGMKRWYIKGPLDGCNYSEVYIDNICGEYRDYSYLCSGMLSDKLMVIIKHPEYVGRLVGLFYENKNMEVVSIASEGGGVVDLRNVTDTSLMFSDCKNLIGIDLNNINFGKVERMIDMFSGCEKLECIELKGIDSSNLKLIRDIFNRCYNLRSIDLRALDLSSVEDIDKMCYECSNLESIKFNSDIEINNVRSMSSAFMNCKELRELDLSMFNTQYVENMEKLFLNCNKLVKLDVRRFNTKNVKKMDAIFKWCSSLKELKIKEIDMRNVQIGYRCDNGIKYLTGDTNSEILKGVEIKDRNRLEYTRSDYENRRRWNRQG